MQRELKFRMLIIVDKKFSHWHYWGFINGEFVGPDARWVNTQSEQFTGLKDKNGLDIYEGDVCRAFAGEEHQGYREFDVTGRVEFLSGGFFIVDKDRVCYDFGNMETILVLDNATENPELLK